MKQKEIDSRVMDVIRENIAEVKSAIRQEVNKASLIVGYLGTFFFVFSSKLSLLDKLLVRIGISGTFVISLLLSFFVIFSGKVRQLDVLDFVNRDWDRSVILKRCTVIYLEELRELRKKVLMNNLNILFVALVTLAFLMFIV